MSISPRLCNYLLKKLFIGQINAPANTREGQIKIPVSQKPNSSPIFTGRKDILEKLGKIFVHRADTDTRSRRSCLLWGMGGIGKTQICLKFTEEMSDRYVPLCHRHS